MVEVPKSETTKTITGLSPDTTYYFAAKAYDVYDKESDFSNEVVWSEAAAPPPTSDSTAQTSGDDTVTDTPPAEDTVATPEAEATPSDESLVGDVSPGDLEATFTWAA